MRCGSSGHRCYGNRTSAVRFMRAKTKDREVTARRPCGCRKSNMGPPQMLLKAARSTAGSPCGGRLLALWWPWGGLWFFTLPWLPINRTAAARWLHGRRSIFDKPYDPLRAPQHQHEVAVRFIEYCMAAVQSPWRPPYDFHGTQDRVKTPYHLMAMARSLYDHCTVTLWCYLRRRYGVAVSKKSLMSSLEISQGLWWTCDEQKKHEVAIRLE